MNRWYFIAILFSNLAISASFRKKARKKETIERVEESKTLIVLRLLFTLPILAFLLAYMIHPPSVGWASFQSPRWVQWIGIGLGLLTIPCNLWVFRSIGDNISETVLTKDSHQLVTNGPYRWIRHPLYSSGLMLLLSLSLISRSTLLLFLTLVVFLAIVIIVIPKEEANLREKFGGAYAEYQQKSKRIIPGLF